MTAQLEAVLAKLARHERLGAEDLAVLVECDDLAALGGVAEALNKKINKGIVTFHEHKYLRVLPASQKALSEQDEEKLVSSVLSQAQALVMPSTSELRLLAIAPRKLPLKTLGRLIQALKASYPDRTVRALAAHQILLYERLGQGKRHDILSFLRSSGLDAFEGRGLRPHDQTPLIGGQNYQMQTPLWFEIHRLAHQLGIKSDVALHYGAHLDFKELYHQLSQIRHLQDETGGFLSLIPLCEQWVLSGQPYLALMDLKVVAICRLFFDNIQAIRAPWGRLGVNVAQLALSFGASDLEGSLTHERNSRVVGARPFRSINRFEIKTLVRKSFYEPVERDGRFNHLTNEYKKTYSESVKLDLYKITHAYDRPLLERVCTHGSLMELAQCASEIKSQLISARYLGILEDHHLIDCRGGDLKLGPMASGPLVLELGASDGVSWPEVHKVMEHFLTEQPKGEVVVMGIKALWRLAQKEGISLMALAERLKEHHTVTIESSPYESEDDLTPSEIRRTYQTFHAIDLVTVAKVELAAPYHGQGEPFWKAFFDRLELFNALQNETHGFVGIKVEAALGSYVSLSEYLKAVALTRVALKNIPNVIAPLTSLPWGPVTKRRPSAYQQELLERVAPVVAYFGANDLFRFPGHDRSNQRFEKALTEYGLKLFKRNARYHPY